MRILTTLALLAATSATPGIARGQFGDHEPDGGLRLDESSVQRLRVGVIVRAPRGPCRGVFATIPIPREWPEQQVKVVDEEITPNVQSVRNRTLDGGVEQILISIPFLPHGQEARALVTYEVVRHSTLAPENQDVFVFPKRIDKKTRRYLAPSPSIEVRHAKVRSLAKQLVDAELSAWQQVEVIYDATRDRVEYVEGNALKGAAAALKDGTGNNEDLCSLFIALCRANKIPARTVWVDGHCYAEFYLLDDSGQGHWFPSQVAGARAFGHMSNRQIILQKGDNFRVPEMRKRVRFVPEFLTGKGGGAQPDVQFVRDHMPAE